MLVTVEEGEDGGTISSGVKVVVSASSNMDLDSCGLG